MIIRLDSNTESLLEKISRQQGVSPEKLLENMVASEVRRQEGRVKDTPFATIYDTANSWQPRFDAHDPNLKHEIREDHLARAGMIVRMRQGKHPATSELSEDEARQQYIERLRLKSTKR